MRLVSLVLLAGCSFTPGGTRDLDGGGDGPPGGDATDGDAPTTCTPHALPPAVNVDPAAWSASFLTAPIWNCSGAGTTVIDAAAGTATSSTCELGDVQLANDIAQASGGPAVLVVRLRGLTVSNGHVLSLVGSKPVVLLVAGDVVVDTGGMIDASATGTQPGPGGSLPGLCIDQATGLGGPGVGVNWGGGGGGFGAAGGQGGYDVVNGGFATGAATLTPLRGGCSGGRGSPGAVTQVPGAGGGALQISASGTITIGATGAGNVVASGGGAGANTAAGGGNGGGSGGAILLVAPTPVAFGTGGAARAHGGAGSEGCGSACIASPGTDGHKTDNARAVDTSGVAGGGNGNDQGRAGGLAYVGPNAMTLVPGDLPTKQTGGRGGGGGGGGRIVVTTAAATQACD